jgi:hypothetical protein
MRDEGMPMDLAEEFVMGGGGMTAEDLRARLLKPRLPEEELPVPGVGMIRVRGLNRKEAMMTQSASGAEAIERKIIAMGMVEPTMSESDVGRWQTSATAGELEPISRKIAELSGMLPNSAKEAVKTFEAEPAAEFRILPGGEAGDDGVAIG